MGAAATEHGGGGYPDRPLRGHGGHATGILREAGGGLLSHDLSIAVPSALTGLTTVFGMGTGVALSR